MNAMICLSQAPQNGWETWFSLNYGIQLSGLKVKVPRVKSFKIKPYLAELKKALDVTLKEADPKKPVTKFTAFK
jgi:hypothetical protein